MDQPLPWIIRRPAVIVVTAAVAVTIGVTVPRFGGGARRSRPTVPSPHLDALVKAVGSRRLHEPRLTGGFAHGTVPSVSRSTVAGLTDQPPDVRIAVAEIEKLGMRDQTPDAIGLLGAAYLAIGQTAKAVTLLEEAAATPLPSPRLQSDLAAAYLVRALDDQDAQDVPRALSAAALAAKAQPSLAEALFNRALALERLHLDAESREAWQDYLRVDATSAWAAEARSHLGAPAGTPAEPADERRLIEITADGDAASTASPIVRSNLQTAREWTEEQMLAAWPEAMSTASGAADGLVRRADRIAMAIAEVTGDRYLVDTVAAVRRATAARTATDLARAHATFAKATAQYERNEFVESGRQFEATRGPLDRAGSPLALVARLQIAISAYYASDISTSIRELDALLPAVERRGYPRLLGLTQRMRGLVEAVSARYGASLGHNLRARELFEAVSDRENVAAIESSLAENLEFLGEPRQAWMHRARALAGLRDVRNPRRRHTILVSSVLSCLRQGSPAAASHFQSAVLANAGRWNRPEALAEAHVRQAELHGQLGDIALITRDLAEARRWTAQVPPGSLARQIDARILLAAASFSGDAARLDVSALTNALATLRDSRLSWGLAKAYLARGRAYVARGQPDLAQQDFLQGIQEFERQRATLATETQRVSYFDQPWDLFSEMIRLQTSTRMRPDVALGFAERGRARALLEAVSGADALPLDVPALQQALPEGVAIIYYAVLDDGVVIWRVTSSRLESFEPQIAAADLERLVNRFRAQMTETGGMRETAATLYDMLVRAPLQGLPTQTTVVFVPDGALHALPFAALVDRATGRYLIEDVAMAVAPSGSVFAAATASGQNRRSAGQRSALVVGNPSTGASRELPDLPEADREVREVGGLYARADVVRGTEATRQRFLDAFDRHDVVHFAGHAISNRDFPALSRLAFSAGDGVAADSLFAHELSGLKVRRTEVLVLAACQTSGGRIRRGEGVLSLARPFLAAGVPTVVASLWDVDDRATRALLVPFHAALRDGAPPAQALRSAQLAALADPSGPAAPSAWAGFVVIGSVGAVGNRPPGSRIASRGQNR